MEESNLHQFTEYAGLRLGVSTVGVNGLPWAALQALLVDNHIQTDPKNKGAGNGR